MFVRFRGKDCRIEVKRYPNGNPSIWIGNKCVTSFDPYIDLGTHHVALKNIVDGEDVIGMLQDLGVVGHEIFTLPSWLAKLSVCELKWNEVKKKENVL